MRKWPKSAREVSDENETKLRHSDAGCPKVASVIEKWPSSGGAVTT